MIRTAAYFVAAGVLLAVNAAQAHEQADQLVKAFLGSCVDVLPRVDKIEAMANSMKWKALAGDDLKAMEPQKKGGVTKAWLADISGTPPFFLGTSVTPDGALTVSACSVVNPEAPSNEVLDALKRFISLREPQVSTAEGGMRIRVWITDISGVHLWISLSDSSPTNEPGVTLAAMTRQ